MAREDDRLGELFFAAARLTDEEVGPFLDRACGTDAELRRELEALLISSPDDSDFIATPVLSDLAGLPETLDPRLHRIGPFEILRVLGRGGMGTVYAARQEHPRREVALKVVRFGFGDPSIRKRFEREAGILARLKHPGIAQVYEAGTTAGPDGQPYFAMELVEGLPLDQFTREQSLDLPARLTLVARIADAVEHAHQRGVVHRDIKPANVLVEASGRPKVLDFGVARLTGSDQQDLTVQTLTGQLVGTLAYMSPEQLSGNSSRIGARSDVYSLGVVLYELLAGQLPNDISDRPVPEAARVILEEEPTRLGMLDTHLRGDVETIVSKALAKEPDRRYATAAEFAADLRRTLHHEPIVARPASSIYHLRKFALRHKGLMAGLAATVATLVIGIVVATGLYVREVEARERADTNAEVSRRTAYSALIHAAAAALENESARDAQRLLRQAPVEYRAWEWNHFTSQLDRSSGRTDASGSPWRIGLEHRLLSFADDGWIHISPQSWAADAELVAWRPETGERIARKVAFHRYCTTSPDGQRIAMFVGKPLVLRIEEFRSGKVLEELPLRAARPAPFAPLSPDGQTDAGPRFFEHAGIMCTEDGGFVPSSLAVEFDAQRSYFAGDGGSIHTKAGNARELWDIRSGKRAGVMPARPHADMARCVVGPARRRAAAYSRHSSYLYFVELTASEEVAWIRTSAEANVTHLEFSPDGRTVATGEEDGVVRLWDPATGEQLRALGSHRDEVLRLRFRPDGSQLASISSDRVVHVWELELDADPRVLRAHTSFVYPVAFSPDGARIVSAGWDETVRFWDAESGDLIATVELPFPGIIPGEITFLGTSGELAVATRLGWNGPRHHFILDARTGAITRRLEVPREKGLGWLDPPSVAYDERLSRLVTANMQAVQFWDPRSLGELPGRIPSGRGLALCATADRHLLATTQPPYGNDVVALWDLEAGELVASFEGTGQILRRAAFSPDGTRLVTAFERGRLRVWNTAARGSVQVPLATLKGHHEDVYAIAYSPDGRRIATAGADRTIRIWDARSFDEVALLRGHADYVWSLAFSPDGRRLVSGSGDHTLRIWDTRPFSERIAARRERLRMVAEMRPELERLLAELGDPILVIKQVTARADYSARQREIAEQVLFQLAVEAR